MTTALGISRAGFSVFLISTRNASVGIADMLQRTGAAHVFVSSDVSMQVLIANTLALLSESGLRITQHTMPVFEDLYSPTPDPLGLFESDVDLAVLRNMGGVQKFFLHSSGEFTIYFVYKLISTT